MVALSFLECGSKRSATPLWMCRARSESKAPSPLRSAGALHKRCHSAKLWERMLALRTFSLKTRGFSIAFVVGLADDEIVLSRLHTGPRVMGQHLEGACQNGER